MESAMPKDIKSEIRALSERMVQDFLFYPDGKRLPSYRNLLTHYACSRQTLNLALVQLKREGCIHTEPRAGMFVSRRRKSSKKRVLFLRVDWPCVHAERFSEQFRAEFRDRGFAYSEIRYNPDNLNSALRELKSSMADVLVLWLERGDMEKISILQDLAVPIVFFDSGISLYHTDILDLQQEMFGMMAAKYLLENGHRRTAALITAPLGLTCRGKVNGFLNYMHVNGIEPEVIDCRLKHGDASEAQAEEFLFDLFRKQPPRFTGCFSVNSKPFFQVMRRLDLPEAKRICVVNGNGIFCPPPHTPSASIVFDFKKTVKTLSDGIDEIFHGGTFGCRYVSPKLIEHKKIQGANAV